MNDKLMVVCGGGGFIGGHLVRSLLDQGYKVRSVDIKPFNEWHQRFDRAENVILDLRDKHNCMIAVKGAYCVKNLAANMGGMGFIENNKCLCMLSVLINTHLLMAARDCGVHKFFYSSSACVYNQEKQDKIDITALREEDAYPAMAEDGYGWEKLFSERMCRHFKEDFGLNTFVYRFHNIYGPYGTYDGGREKAPAAICRKVIEAKLSKDYEIEIWGDGTRTRSFMYIDDCIYGINKLMSMDECPEPINLGRSELISINNLVSMVEDIAGVKLKRNHILDAPLGVKGRNSDNTKIKKILGWEPEISLREGMEKTYKWIYGDIRKRNNK